MSEVDLMECPQAIHGRSERTPSGKCPWCEWEDAELALEASRRARAEITRSSNEKNAIIERLLQVSSDLGESTLKSGDEGLRNAANELAMIATALGHTPVSETATGTAGASSTVEWGVRLTHPDSGEVSYRWRDQQNQPHTEQSARNDAALLHRRDYSPTPVSVAVTRSAPVSEVGGMLPEELCGKIGPLEGGLKVVSQDPVAVTTKMALNLKAGRCVFIANHEGKHSWEKQ